MIVPDINVLLYAHFSVFPLHPAARQWWEGIVRRGELIGLAPPVVFGFVRIATHRRVFERPMALQQALALVDGWMALTNVELLRPGPRHVTLAFDLLRNAGTSRDLTTNAQIAAYALECRGAVHRADADFARFPGVPSIDPLTASK